MTRMSGYQRALIFIGLSIAGCRGGLSSTSVFYVPIGAETYLAITPENISSQRVCPLREADARKVRDIISAAAPGGGVEKFGRQRVRVKIVEQGTTSSLSNSLIDNEGGVLRSGGYFRLSTEDLGKLKKAIEHSCDSM